MRAAAVVALLVVVASCSFALVAANLKETQWAWTGASSRERCGHVVDVADVTGGGDMDVVIGSPHFGMDKGVDSRAEQGKVTVLADANPSGGAPSSLSAQVISTPCATTQLNTAVDGASAKTVNARGFFGANVATGLFLGKDNKMDILTSAYGCTTVARDRVLRPESGNQQAVSNGEFDWGGECSSSAPGGNTLTRIVREGAWLDLATIPEGKKDVSITMSVVNGYDVDIYVDDISRSTYVRLIGYYSAAAGGTNAFNYLDKRSTCTCNNNRFSDAGTELAKRHITAGYDRGYTSCFSCSDSTGRCSVGKECCQVRSRFVYKPAGSAGFGVRWSGHVCNSSEGTRAKGTEWIDIEGTTDRPLKVSVQGYEAGTATVRYFYTSSCVGDSDGAVYTYQGATSVKGAAPQSRIASHSPYSFNQFGSAVALAGGSSTVAAYPAAGSVGGQLGGNNAGLAERFRMKVDQLGQVSGSSADYKAITAALDDQLYAIRMIAAKFGSTDVLVYATPRAAAGATQYAGVVEVRDAATHTLRCAVAGTQGSAGFGYALAEANLGTSAAAGRSLVVGSPYYSSSEQGIVNQGRVYVYVYGASAGTSHCPFNTNNPVTINGPSSTGGMFGFAVAGLGDTDGDGLGDLIVGAPTAQNAGGNVVGAVYVYTARAGGINTDPAQIIYGASAGGLFGFSLSRGARFKGESYNGVAVGAPGVKDGNAPKGRVTILAGVPNAELALQVVPMSQGAGGAAAVDGHQTFFTNLGTFGFNVLVTVGNRDAVPAGSGIQVQVDAGVAKQEGETAYGDHLTPTTPAGCSKDGLVYTCLMQAVSKGAVQTIAFRYADLDVATEYPYRNVKVEAKLLPQSAASAQRITVVGAQALATVSASGSIEAAARLQWKGLDGSTGKLLMRAFENGSPVTGQAVTSSMVIKFDAISVTNNGPATAFGVSVAATQFPRAFRFQDATSTATMAITDKDGGALSLDGVQCIEKSVSCEIPVLPAGATFTRRDVEFKLDQTDLSRADLFVVWTAKAARNSRLAPNAQGGNPVTAESNKLPVDALVAKLGGLELTLVEASPCWGEAVTFVATVQNGGPAPASNARWALTSPGAGATLADKPPTTNAASAAEITEQSMAEGTARLALRSMPKGSHFISMGAVLSSKAGAASTVRPQVVLEQDCDDALCQDYKKLEATFAAPDSFCQRQRFEIGEFANVNETPAPGERGQETSVDFLFTGPTEYTDDVIIEFKFTGFNPAATTFTAVLRDEQFQQIGTPTPTVGGSSVKVNVGKVPVSLRSRSLALAYTMPDDFSERQASYKLCTCIGGCAAGAGCSATGLGQLDENKDDDSHEGTVTLNHEVVLDVNVDLDISYPFEVRVGRHFTYTATVSNSGVNPGKDVVVTFPVVDGLTYTRLLTRSGAAIDGDAEFSNCVTASDGSTATCTVKEVPVGRQAVFKVEAKPSKLQANIVHKATIALSDSGTALFGSLSYTGTAPQLVSGVESAQLVVDLEGSTFTGRVGPLDLAGSGSTRVLDKSGDVWVYRVAPEISDGDDLTLNIRAGNKGPSTAESVQVSVQYKPSNVEPVDTTGWSCSGTDTVTCLKDTAPQDLPFRSTDDCSEAEKAADLCDSRCSVPAYDTVYKLTFRGAGAPFVDCDDGQIPVTADSLIIVQLITSTEKAEDGKCTAASGVDIVQVQAHNVPRRSNLALVQKPAGEPALYLDATDLLIEYDVKNKGPAFFEDRSAVFTVDVVDPNPPNLPGLRPAADWVVGLDVKASFLASGSLTGGTAAAGACVATATGFSCKIENDLVAVGSEIAGDLVSFRMTGRFDGNLTQAVTDDAGVEAVYVPKNLAFTGKVTYDAAKQVDPCYTARDFTADDSDVHTYSVNLFDKKQKAKNNNGDEDGGSNSTGLIVAFAVGIPLIIIIGVVLWKVGFFKRREKPPTFGESGYGEGEAGGGGMVSGDDMDGPH